MIRGIVTAVPKYFEHNDDAKFVAATGVYERRIAQPGQDVLTLATAAARTLLNKLQGWEPQGIVFVTQTPTVRMPGMACGLHRQLGLNGSHTNYVLDVNAACSGYVYGLHTVVRLGLERILLVAGDTVSRMCDPNDRGSTRLFGDAVSVTAVDRPGNIYPFVLDVNSDGFDKLIADPTIRMDGAEVFTFALNSVCDNLVKMRMFCGEPKLYLFHQANKMILDRIIKKADISSSVVPMNMQKYGNTSSASIPLLMCDSGCTERLKTIPNTVLMCGFGAGFTIGLWQVDLDPISILEVIEV